MEILDSNANMNDDFSSNLVMLCRKYASLQGQNALKWSQRVWLPRVHNEEIHNGLKTANIHKHYNSISFISVTDGMIGLLIILALSKFSMIFHSNLWKDTNPKSFSDFFNFLPDDHSLG